MSESSAKDSIHGNLIYINFEFELNFSLLFPIAPFCYIVPTIVVMWKIFKGYQTQPANLTKLTLDGHLFSLLMCYFITNIAFFFSDLFRFNLPSSGLITSWCAKLQPNYSFTLLILVADFLNYCILILPFLVSIIRLTLLRSAYNNVNASENRMDATQKN